MGGQADTCYTITKTFRVSSYRYRSHRHDITAVAIMAARKVQEIEEDLKNIEFETSEDVDVTTTFDGMGIREDLLRGIYAYGFEKPSAIQQRAIKPRKSCLPSAIT